MPKKNVLPDSFGFAPTVSCHHFLVNIFSNQTYIEISEHFTWSETLGSGPISYGSQFDGQIRVKLDRGSQWDRIADPLRTEFNRRLRQMGYQAGKWQSGHNLVRRELGKESVLLAWAIEDAEIDLIPAAIANWNGLEPEERWWLYTQTTAVTGHGLKDRDKGWRKAVRYALTENPLKVAS